MVHKTEMLNLLKQHGINLQSLETLRDAEEESVFAFPLHGKDAISMWTELRNIVSDTHYWPVVLGTSLDLKYLAREFSRFQPSSAIEGAL